MLYVDASKWMCTKRELSDPNPQKQQSHTFWGDFEMYFLEVPEEQRVNNICVYIIYPIPPAYKHKRYSLAIFSLIPYDSYDIPCSFPYLFHIFVIDCYPTEYAQHRHDTCHFQISGDVAAAVSHRVSQCLSPSYPPQHGFKWRTYLLYRET